MDSVRTWNGDLQKKMMNKKHDHTTHNIANGGESIDLKHSSPHQIL
jgi:hypothetical protein